MPETGWVRLYMIRDDERIETNGPVMSAADWIAAEQSRLESLGRKVEVKHSRAERSWTLRTYVEEPLHIEGMCWCDATHPSMQELRKREDAKWKAA